jgi:hypothetical protein
VKVLDMSENSDDQLIAGLKKAYPDGPLSATIDIEGNHLWKKYVVKDGKRKVMGIIMPNRSVSHYLREQLSFGDPMLKGEYFSKVVYKEDSVGTPNQAYPAGTLEMTTDNFGCPSRLGLNFAIGDRRYFVSIDSQKGMEFMSIFSYTGGVSKKERIADHDEICMTLLDYALDKYFPESMRMLFDGDKT